MNFDKRKRRICPTCGDTFSARHFYRHEQTCQKSNNQLYDVDDDNSNSDPDDQHNLYDKIINKTLCKPAFDAIIRNQETKNLEEEDAVFFEQSTELNDSLSDSDSEYTDSKSVTSDCELECDLDSKDEDSLIQWIYIFLCLWQIELLCHS